MHYGTFDFGTKCQLCHNKKHRHISSAIAISRAKGENIFCQICNRKHVLDFHPTQNIVILGSSTLFIDFKQWKWAEECIFYELRGGGKIQDLKQVYKDLYSEIDLPFIFVMVGGLNDIKYLDKYEFMTSLVEFKNMVEQHKNHRIFFSELLMPPLFCMGQNYNLTPSSELYRNILFINKELQTLQTHTFPLSSYGIRKRKNSIVFKVQFWREMRVKRLQSINHEQRIFHCLHLTNQKQAIALKNLIDFIKQHYCK